MLRVANILMVGALLLTAAVVYQLKYASTAEAERLASLRAAIRKERDSIAVMKAEWARRTSPFYIQGLVERHLDLKRLDVESISDLASLPPKPADKADGIGGIIEALVDEPLVTSSVGKASSPAPSGGGPTSSSGAATVPATSALRPPPPRTPPSTGPVASAGPRPPATPRPAAAPPVPVNVTPPQSAPAAAPQAEPEGDAVGTFFRGFLSGR